MDPPRRFRPRHPRSGAKVARLGVGFDFDHTLGIDNKLERVAFLRLLEQLLAQGGRSGPLSTEIAGIDALLERQRAGAFSIDVAVSRFVGEHLDGAAARNYVEAYKRFALDSVDEFVVPMPGVHQTLRRLQERGFALAILTNGWSPLQERKAARVRFPGAVLVSETIGVQKPQPQAFGALLRALQVEPQDAWFVGDNPQTDVAGSLGAGLRGVWFDAEGVDYPGELARPSAVVHALEELLEVLPGASHPL
ncbi:MAG: hypothetical protein NVS1B14_01530 [Vulcanimicrobiaceae bacterium]